MKPADLVIKKLSTGYWHIRGNGPCQWVQVPYWPCEAGVIIDGAFCQASREFIQEVINAANKLTPEEQK